MLTSQLRELEADRLIHREVYAQVPPKVEYSLTPYGETLKPLLKMMCTWGKIHMQQLEDREELSNREALDPTAL